MSLIPEIANPFVAAFAGGLLYGLAVCTASCLPYIASYIAGVGAGFRRSVAITMIFNGGRIVAYAFIGCLVGLFSSLFRMLTSNSVTSPLQTYSSLAFGILTMAIGAMIIVQSKKKPKCGGSDSQNAAAISKPGRFGFDVKAFTLGLGRGLILCPPLIALLVYSFPFSTPLGSVTMAVLFGFGTALSPMLLLGGVTGWLLNKAPLLRRWISLGGAAVLIILGLAALVNSLLQI